MLILKIVSAKILINIPKITFDLTHVLDTLCQLVFLRLPIQSLKFTTQMIIKKPYNMTINSTTFDLLAAKSTDFISQHIRPNYELHDPNGS